MFKKILTACAMLGVVSTLGACAGVGAVGPYNGLDSSAEGAKAKIGCFDFNDDLTPEKAAVCEDQAVKCQVQQNRMASNFGETAASNAVVSAGLGGASQHASTTILGATAKVVGKYTEAGMVVGAISSVNNSMIIYSQASDSAVGGCSRDFMARYKALNPKDEAIKDVYVETELVRANLRNNVNANHR